jgi:hypothetical protein
MRQIRFHVSFSWSDAYMLKVLLASRNAGKLHEFSSLLPELEFVLWPAEAPELPETGAFLSASPSAIRETSGSRFSSFASQAGSPIAGAR